MPDGRESWTSPTCKTGSGWESGWSSHATRESSGPAVCSLSLPELAERGMPPAEALAQFGAWVIDHTPEGARPVFVGFNAAFDWMFINDYFHRFLIHNPFGHNALDIKAFYMGLTGGEWTETTMAQVAARYGQSCNLTHNALEDAQIQGQLFRATLDEARQRI